jgi:hypothetical protein
MATKEKMSTTSDNDPPQALDEESVRARAYETSQSEDAGTPDENWYRAEQEIRAGHDGDEPPSG